jgi:UPF0176 protein
MSTDVTVTTFYRFGAIADPLALRAPLLEQMRALQIRGTITLAQEGINATISGAAAAIENLITYLGACVGLAGSIQRESYVAAQPFRRSKVKVKRELISLGVPAHPAQCVGEYVAPAHWNALIAAPDVILIDTRNAYEYDLGHFDGALNPGTRHFKQMVQWTKTHLDPASGRRIAMYCTGGIRCEKYSSYLVSLGFPQVYHLHGGILAYLEQIPEPVSRWRGSCFVFDERVAVGHGLLPVPAHINVQSHDFH